VRDQGVDRRCERQDHLCGRHEIRPAGNAGSG
jgi:hypothetical protein